MIKLSGQPYWLARIEDEQGITHNLARILSSNATIYDADVSMEEGWAQAEDPHEFGIFHFINPQYYKSGYGFTEWPASNGTDNILHTAPEDICPLYYGAWTYIDGNPRYWVAGTGGDICEAVMFPKPRAYLPLIMNE